MAIETVKIYVVDQEVPTAGPIEGVLVRVFDQTGATFITQDYTDVDGVADFSLDGDDPAVVYQIRLSKIGVAFDGNLGSDSKSPQLIEVYSPPTSAPNGTNEFQVKGQTFTRPVAVDPRLCRLSGFFRRGDGLPYSQLDVIFTPDFKPSIVDGRATISNDINTRTDDAGYLEIDLFRGATYTVSIEGLEDQPRCIYVPDASSENLIDLLLAVVESVVFDPSTIDMSVGDVQDVAVVVTASDQRVLAGSGKDDVVYTMSDPLVAQVTVLDDKITITGLAVGTTELTVARRDDSIVVVPDTGITFTPLQVTVS